MQSQIDEKRQYTMKLGTLSCGSSLIGSMLGRRISPGLTMALSFIAALSFIEIRGGHNRTIQTKQEALYAVPLVSFLFGFNFSSWIRFRPVTGYLVVSAITAAGTFSYVAKNYSILDSQS